MMKFNGKSLYLLAATVIAMLFCGCRSDIYYQNRAIERARVFLLKEAKDLTWQQREFIRYSDPVLMHSHIIGSRGLGTTTSLSSEQRQICVTWQIPGKKELYMVFGVSGARMANWYPERLLRKYYVTRSAPLAAVSAEAFNYARNNLFSDLSPADLNRIRFSAPALIESNFAVSVSAPASATPAEKAAFEEAHGKKMQLTLCWKLNGKNSVFFCGFGNPDLSQWSISRAGIIQTSELESRTVRTILSPEQSLEKLPELAVRNRIGCECEHSENCIREGVCKAPRRNQERK